MLSLTLNPTVGVAPGTTTMRLGLGMNPLDTAMAQKSLQEEMDAIGAYGRRLTQAQDPRLVKAIQHARREEKQHAASFQALLGGGWRELSGLGVCPPGYYGQAIMLPGTMSTSEPGAGAAVSWEPYGTESTMKGLRGLRGLRGSLGAIPWSMLIMAAGLSFASWLGYSYWREHRT